MTPSCRYTILASTMAIGQLVAGCNEPPDAFLSAEKPAARSVSEQADSNRLKADDKPKQEEQAAIIKKQKARKPLDLRMPPQPEADPGSIEDTRLTEEQILPDLFEQEKKRDERSIRLKGRVLMEQPGQEGLDSIQGGQVIMEMKSR